MSNLQAEKSRHRHIDLSNAVIPRSNFSHANLSAANLEGANLTGANFSMASLVGAKLSKALLRGASFYHANLSNADLSGADLSGANLKGALLEDANLSGAILQNAELMDTNFSDARNITWNKLLEGRINEKTVIPDYLDDDSLFICLEGICPQIEWRKEFAGRVKDLLIELGKISDSVEERSLYNTLIKLSVHLGLEGSADA